MMVSTASKNIKDIADKIKKIDFCMMSTHGATGTIANRPMSNNGDVEFDGDLWFFSFKDTRKVADIARDPRVTLSFTEAPSLFGKPGIFISVEGVANIIDDMAAFQEHWVSGLDRWFPEGTETPGLVLIQVCGKRIEYWDGEDNGAIAL